MSDETDPHPVDPALEPEGRKLDNLAEIRRALKFVCRRIEAGTLEPKVGNALVFALNTLAGLHIDARDSKWLPRVKELWREREQAKQPEAH